MPLCRAAATQVMTRRVMTISTSTSISISMAEMAEMVEMQLEMQLGIHPRHWRRGWCTRVASPRRRRRARSTGLSCLPLPPTLTITLTPTLTLTPTRRVDSTGLSCGAVPTRYRWAGVVTSPSCTRCTSASIGHSTSSPRTPSPPRRPMLCLQWGSPSAAQLLSRRRHPPSVRLGVGVGAW